ncbi:bifunctional 4-hydroxy-2-oxoglutarate aldolase/2-dehydro-3-deoxy-phosphogluconate aldolase [Tunicatimonas pelagia]|uniref:bifunctional 4-hydroxy-2-oxoglutarate aldolase/2-dehydro-3-deoxy-phosphogluconate aldolase n=1 Tax=Tunicatimonas pelagia TaxID=931531 RepID=UPI0026662D0C|nr:bifunctional 4-hydroxy-2-oxoglutarate aldolase/2-dehydro-3-deoxy-phosphogluconate aldolase [Tunicatimonas pelagia]WKN42963.1 bifunctional 4-hydroxy-2-oxoglutarate aldolase/2-dehydro-3-deoxy-phosphogluconate aldolase [Tunicatimonas pelagia]
MATDSSFSWERYYQAPIVGIVRSLPLDTIRPITQVYQDAGLFTLEITMNTPGAPKIISLLRKEFPGMNIGAGTVCTMNDLTLALNAGAQFIVTPILDERVVKHTVARQIPIFPGAYSPTEIHQAWSWGAAAVKVFPATQLGVQFIKDILAPLNQIKLLPTGGVSQENIRSFFVAGAVGVGMGSSLLDKQLIEEKDFDSLNQHFIKIKGEIQDFIQS